MKKRLFISALLVMIILALVACGRNGNASGGGKPAGNGKDTNQVDVYGEDVDWSTNSELNQNSGMSEIDLSRSEQWNDAPSLSIQFYDIVVSSGMSLDTLLSRVAQSKFKFYYDINPERLINDYDTYTFYDGFNMEVFSVKVGKFGDSDVEPARDCIIMEIKPYDYSCCRFFDGRLSYDDIMNYTYSEVPQLLDIIKERNPHASIDSDGLNYSTRRAYWGSESVNPPESAYLYGKQPRNVADIRFSVNPDTAKISTFTYEAVISDNRNPIYRYDQNMHISEAHLDDPWESILNFSEQVEYVYNHSYNQGEEYGSVVALYMGIASDFTEASTECIWYENDVTFLYLIFDNKKGYSAEGYGDLSHCNVHNEVQETYRKTNSVIGNDGRYYAKSEEELIDFIFSKYFSVSEYRVFGLTGRDSNDTLHGLKKIIRITPEELRNLVDFDFK